MRAYLYTSRERWGKLGHLTSNHDYKAAICLFFLIFNKHVDNILFNTYSITAKSQGDKLLASDSFFKRLFLSQMAL